MSYSINVRVSVALVLIFLFWFCGSLVQHLQPYLNIQEECVVVVIL